VTGLVFGPDYSTVYDTIYAGKDYSAECDLIERVLREFGTGRERTILDVGCGTGSHALALGARGYEVAGVDRSAAMLAEAERKAEAAGLSGGVRFFQEDMTRYELGMRFDAAIMMFAVLGYQTRNEGVLAALRQLRRHLEPGGILVFDAWYGPAVLHQRPAERSSTIPTEDGRIERIASGSLDPLRHVTTVSISLREFEGERLRAETREEHTMRFFFPLELDHLLESSGFSLLRLGAFPDYHRDPDEGSWNILAVARAGADR